MNENVALINLFVKYYHMKNSNIKIYKDNYVLKMLNDKEYKNILKKLNNISFCSFTKDYIVNTYLAPKLLASKIINEIKKFCEEYTIETTTKIINKETEENEINNIVEIKKQEYEEAQAKAAAEAEAKRKAEEQAKKEQEQTKSTTTYSSSSYSLSALQSYAYDLVINSYGWLEEDFNALINLWNRESGWNPNLHNSSSGAHGIPQALPASKMASEGSDYYTNGETQIRWGLKYIAQRYGSPLNAWNHFQSVGWY